MTAGTVPAVPRLGQHTTEVLAELGYCAAEIHTMARAGAIGVEQAQQEPA